MIVMVVAVVIVVVAMIVAMIVMVVAVVIVIVVVFVTFALQHVHGDVVWQSEAVVALCFNVERNHAVFNVGFVVMVVV